VSIERTIGAVNVLGFARTTSISSLEALARRFETDAAVRYADPVRRVVPHRVPNDPLFAQQWSLVNVNASVAWDAGTGSSGVTVAVVDTGHLDHPDLAGRVLPGHDFIADAERARDGDARDANPRDEGDWAEDGECGGPAYPSFFHGLFVAGLIAANSDNDVGIAGLDWSAKILPVRVLGRCGGTSEDVVAGMLWAAGAPVDGAPLNPNPAKIINLSLGGFGECSAAEQEAVNEALAQGTFVVASAGNETDDAALYSPGSCGGVINVGALSRSGERSSYSNWGRRVDISAPGGDVDTDGLMVSTHAAGTTTPGEPGYESGMGTSFSAPLVSGTLSLMIARNPNLTAGQALTILQGSASEFAAGSPCVGGTFCGAGALNAGLAIASTFPATTEVPSGGVAIVEYYDPVLDHYLITADPVEIESLDVDPRFQRTGHVFYGWASPELAPDGVIPQSVCRFYAGPEHLIDSHYFTADPAECGFIASREDGVWTLQSVAAFWIEVPEPGGRCREGTLPVFRFFNGRRDASQRHTIDLSVRRTMNNRAWVADGHGENGAAMCSLI
jgi:serine protease